MKMLKKTLLLSLVAAASAPALAYEAGDVIVRVGAAQVTPDTTDNTMLPPMGVGTLDADDDTQLGLSVTYMLSPKLGLELLGASPFEHDITLSGTKIGSTKHLPPTVSLQFFPLDSGAVQPYVGAGLNYTKFFGEESNLGVLALEDSLGLAVEAGVDVKVADNIVINAAVWKVDINTNVTLNRLHLGELEIDPVVAMIGVGMKF